MSKITETYDELKELETLGEQIAFAIWKCELVGAPKSATRTIQMWKEQSAELHERYERLAMGVGHVLLSSHHCFDCFDMSDEFVKFSERTDD